MPILREFTLFSARTTDGNSAAVVAGVRGPSTFIVYGTFDGATVKLQASPDGTNWTDVPSASLTAAGRYAIPAMVYKYARANVSNDGAGTSITAVLQR